MQLKRNDETIAQGNTETQGISAAKGGITGARRAEGKMAGRKKGEGEN